MEILSNKGRTATVFRVKQGLAAKMPRDIQGLPDCEEFAVEVDNAFAVEDKLLRKLGSHPRIVVYHGRHMMEGMKPGLLLDEANCGDLQSYIDKHNAKIDNALRKKWSLQAAQAVAYVHENGIIHSNVSTTNFLVHWIGQTPDLLLADFGGSKCVELNLDGDLLPDDPFSDPRLTDYYSPKVDVFSLGVVIYVIMTGHYPFQTGPAPQNEERFIYGDRVRALFEQGQFPNLSDVPFGDTIAGCCCMRRFKTAQDVVAALEEEMERQCYAAVMD